MHHMKLDAVAKAPDIVGTNGRAWQVDGKAFALSKGREPASNFVMDWIVEAPWAHPYWHSYVITCINLRPSPELPHPLIRLKGATHELWVQALNGDALRQPQIVGEAPLSVLTPANFIAQFVAESDAAAMARVLKTIAEICDGKLNPDTDARAQWIARYGDNMLRRPTGDLTGGATSDRIN